MKRTAGLYESSRVVITVGGLPRVSNLSTVRIVFLVFFPANDAVIRVLVGLYIEQRCLGISYTASAANGVAAHFYT